ncbi:MAG: Calx-beta domain-containing protein [Methylococcales bacterium]|nr:Calx-beta domain-containing protein [Methylococcales bacterium]
MLTKVYSGQPFLDGVFKITEQVGDKRSYGSGVLLAGGQYILTAAHLFSDNPSVSNVHVINTNGQSVGAVEQIFTHPFWDNNPADYNHDLALIKLTQPLTQTAGYEIYRNKNEIGQTFTRVGFSDNGLVSGKNTYDAVTDKINAAFGTRVEIGSQLLYDYDDGTSQHDAIGQLLNLPNLGLGNEETMSQAGLSGGGTFIDNKIAGVGSFIFRSDLSDINSVIDSSIGELGSDTRVSTHADWIDFITLGNPVYNAPTLASEVMKNVLEPNYGSVENYFLASFNEPLTHDISFDFRTVDGTAIAGIDYLATQGQIVLHAGQNHIAIPVTILGDKIAEMDETFSFEVSNPVGFSFLNNALVLTATHSIIDNDAVIF